MRAVAALTVVVPLLAACGHTSGSVFANGGEVVDAGGEVVDASGDEPPCSTLPPADPCPTGVCSCGLGCDFFSCYMCTGGGYVAVNDCPPPPPPHQRDAGPSTAIGTFTAPDCPGCKFPNNNATSCDANAPTIAVAYPLDGVLLPPNLNALSIQWTPYGGYSTYELDFSNAVTDMRIITKCTSQTMDTGQPSTGSGGCEMVLNSGVMTFLTSANRGGDPITLNVRGTTDGKCASSSPKSVTLSFSDADIFGALYYWKSTASANGVGGQIWAEDFGDARPAHQVTGTAAIPSSCNGCHVLSRDGSRMVLYSDEDDSDDEYGDIAGSLVDVATMTPLAVSGGTGGALLPVGFGAFSPDRSYVLTSNGIGASPTNAFAIWSGVNGASGGAVAVGASGDRPTMPDWSPDGASLAYVLPTKVASWNSGARIDDDHIFGGSLYTMPYSGGGQVGTSRPLVTSAGENNYYPSYSPDGRFVLFDRAPLDMTVAAVDGCTGTAPRRICPNDSFSNPAARVMLLSGAGGAAPVDLERANGSPRGSPSPASNSWPRWAPFFQTYKGRSLAWITFSSTRDYGVRVLNHKSGMTPCYPPGSFEDPGDASAGGLDGACQQPQIWMAAVDLSRMDGADSSFAAFWLPLQDITTHNHTAQWAQGIVATQALDAGACIASGGECARAPSTCCAGLSCGASGVCQ